MIPALQLLPPSVLHDQAKVVFFLMILYICALIGHQIYSYRFQNIEPLIFFAVVLMLLVFSVISLYLWKHHYNSVILLVSLVIMAFTIVNYKQGVFQNLNLSDNQINTSVMPKEVTTRPSGYDEHPRARE